MSQTDDANVPPSAEVARQMFEDAPPGSPELEEATKLRTDAIVRELDDLRQWKADVIEHGLCMHNVPINRQCESCDGDFAEKGWSG